ncbi:uncharacterized protein cenpt [Lycodopsis pacificus]
MDPTEDLSARVLLKHILSTETPRTPITRSFSKAQTTNRTSNRRSKKDAGPQTPQDILKRNLKHKIRESVTRQSLPSTHKRAASVRLRKMNTSSPTSLLFDDGETPRHMLMNILQTEPVKSPVVHEKGASEEPQPSSADSSITRKRPSIELSGLDLPDITIGYAESTAKGLSRKRPRRSLNVTAFEKRLQDGEDVEEESEESLGDHSSLSSSSSTSLSLKTPFVDVRTEKKVLLRRISNRRKTTVEEFGAAVNKRQMGGVSSFVQEERGLSETADSEGFTLGLSKLGEPDITTDILHCNTALYAQPDAMTSSFSIIATQDKPTAMAGSHTEDDIATRSQSEEEEAAADSQTEEEVVFQTEDEGAGESQMEEEQGGVDSRHEEDVAARSQSEEEEAAADSQTEEEQGGVDSQHEEDVAARSQSEEEEAAADSQTDEDGAVESQTEEEQGAVDSHTEEDVATRSQPEEEEAAADSQTEEEQGGVDSQHEEDVAARSQSEEEEAAADSQTDEDGAVESQTEEEQGAVDSHTEEDVATRSQPEEEEAAADSQTEEEVAVDSQTEEEQGGVDSQHEEDMEARSQSEEEDFAPDSQKEEEEDAVDSQIKEDGAVELQSVEYVIEYQSNQEDPTANSLPEDEHAGRPVEEDDETSEQLEPDLGHISRRAHRSEGGLTMPVIVAGGDTGWSDGKSKAHSSLDMGSHESGQLHIGITDLAESSTQRRTNATCTEVDADEENSFNLPEVMHDIEDVDSPEEAAVQDPAEQVEEEEDDEDSDDIPSKTPAFVKQKIHFFQRNALASPSVFKNIQASSSTGEGPSAKQKQVRKRRKGPAKKETDLPKSYLMGVFKHFAKTNVSADVYPVLKEIMDKYFERLAEDLETYAGHAKRKTIEFEDAELLLKRQGYVNDKVPVEVLIEKYLRMDQRKLLIPIATSGNVVIPKKRR